MNIAIEDIKYLERVYGEEPTGGKVWAMAQEGKSFYEISLYMEAESAIENEETRCQH